MAHFYGMVHGKGSKPVAKSGTKATGVTTKAAGWQGCIEVSLHYDEERGRDMFEVRLRPWASSGGKKRVIAEGILDSSIEHPYIPALIA